MHPNRNPVIKLSGLAANSDSGMGFLSTRIKYCALSNSCSALRSAKLASLRTNCGFKGLIHTGRLPEARSVVDVAAQWV